MEVARVSLRDRALVADGMQVGADYGLRYHLEPPALTLELVGRAPRTIHLANAEFFDLAWSPLFNSLPVLRDGLLGAGPPRTYRMQWVDVPSLAVHLSEQAYEPLGNGVVAFRAGEFTAELTFDADGFVTDYPGLARRL
jgi:hypothetical protein